MCHYEYPFKVVLIAYMHLKYKSMFAGEHVRFIDWYKAFHSLTWLRAWIYGLLWL